MASLKIQPPLLWTAGTIWPPVCAAVVAARFATRNAQRAKCGPDDWFILPALVLVFGMAAAVLAGVGLHGLGYPTPIPVAGASLTTTSPQQIVVRKIYWSFVLIQLAALMFIKLSCMFFYKRIFGRGAPRLVSIMIHTMIALITIWGLGFFFGFLFACRTHFNYVFTDVEEQLKCANLAMIQESLAVSDVVMDVIVFVFPIPLILRLQMSAANKVAVLGIFTLGALAIAASITRLAIIVQELSAQFDATADQDYVSTAGVYFMFIEACFGLTAVCLPSLSGAFKLKGVQTMIAGFTSVFSNLSRSSVRSGASKSSKTRGERLVSETPKVSSSETDVEMYAQSRYDDGIKVTNNIEQVSARRDV